ncbi:Polysaccharide ABC transporter, ATP-binding protein [Flavobacteriaceae bacterium 3519-10]|nr:Polysaccharide ABC transporter, ATP-binding protein [Flavobacteriaceae bacterium 3519-10]
MNCNIAIKAVDISKQYRLGEVGTGTITHDLNRAWARLRGKEDPFLKIGESNDRATKGESDYVWSLKDINFEIEKGDAVGIIGRNGAGKSTLLKLLSRVTKPTTGHFEVQGRIASLLEVGTGFNPEMTGRENIFLNGAILGMRRHEIKRKFDEIVDFAGVERYIDTPVKRYSSGMYVRLAFAVAAHLESEILIVDEVLAVGDAEFQKKCLGKMGDVSKGEGRTVLFVSHNMAAVKNLCNHGILLENGNIDCIGNIDKVVNNYLYLSKNDAKSNFYAKDNQVLKSVEIITDFANIKIGESLRIKFDLNCISPTTQIHLGIHDLENLKISHLTTEYFADLKLRQNSITCVLPKLNLTEGDYYINVLIKDKSVNERYENCLQFHVSSGSYYVDKIPVVRQYSSILMDHFWCDK